MANIDEFMKDGANEIPFGVELAFVAEDISKAGVRAVEGMLSNFTRLLARNNKINL